MRNLLWQLGRPIDWLARAAIIHGREWQAHRLSVSLRQEYADPLIKEMSASMTDEGKFEAEVVIEKFPAVMDLGLEMMELMNDYPEAANYFSMSSLAPDGKLYTISVKHDTSKPEYLIIGELKQEIARLTEEIDNAQKNPTQEN